MSIRRYVWSPSSPHSNVKRATFDVFIHTYIQTYTHTSIKSRTHTHKNTCIFADMSNHPAVILVVGSVPLLMRTCIHTNIHTNLHTQPLLIRTYKHKNTQKSIHSFSYAYTRKYMYICRYVWPANSLRSGERKRATCDTTSATGDTCVSCQLRYVYVCMQVSQSCTCDTRVIYMCFVCVLFENTCIFVDISQHPAVILAVGSVPRLMHTWIHTYLDTFTNSYTYAHKYACIWADMSDHPAVIPAVILGVCIVPLLMHAYIHAYMHTDIHRTIQKFLLTYTQQYIYSGRYVWSPSSDPSGGHRATSHCHVFASQRLHQHGHEGQRLIKRHLCARTLSLC